MIPRGPALHDPAYLHRHRAAKIAFAGAENAAAVESAFSAGPSEAKKLSTRLGTGPMRGVSRLGDVNAPICPRHDLATMKHWLKALEAKMARVKMILTEARAACRKFSGFYGLERRGRQFAP